MYTPLHCHSHYSLLDGLSKPYQMASVAATNGFKACALTDHGSISGAVAFQSAMKGVCSNCGHTKGEHKDKWCPGNNTTYSEAKIKPILGCEFYIPYMDATIQDANNKRLQHLVVLAKNKDGWSRLIEANSRANDEDLFYYKPRLDWDRLAEYLDGNIVGFSGHLGSQLNNCLFRSDMPYDVDDPSQWLIPGAKDVCARMALKMQEAFGKGNFFIEIQLMDSLNSPKAKLSGDILREVSKETGIPCVATPDAHYARKEDADDQRVILCAALKTTLKEVRIKMRKGEDVPLGGFFSSNNFEIPTLDTMQSFHTEEELANTMLIEDMCENYSILGKPKLPHFPCPEGLSEIEYVRQLCREGYTKHLSGRDINPQEYGDRVNHELDVIEGANLGGYFLIVQDYVNWARDNGMLIGPGRGSGAGSLVSYLLGITLIDPIPHDLLFSRFYNAGRNTAERVALPDIDVDFPIKRREEVIRYINERYGDEHVCQMATFSRMQGRGALKEVLRVHDACGFQFMNEITKNIPQEAEISDQLEAAGEHSILRWTLEYDPERVSDYCRLNDDGTLAGEYAPYFEQAIRLEGTYSNMGKHAAGLVISGEQLSHVCPMVRDKKGNKIAGMEMNDLEAMGHVKFDILGVAILDKLMYVNKLLGEDC